MAYGIDLSNYEPKSLALGFSPTIELSKEEESPKNDLEALNLKGIVVRVE